MAQIMMTPDVLRGKASEVRSLRTQHDDVITKMRSLVNGLTDSWMGQAQSAFVSQFESMQSTFSAFSDLMESYAQKMDVAATTMEQTDSALASKMGG